MTFEVGLFLCLLGVALILFSIEWFSAEIVAMGLLLMLVLTGLLSPENAFRGFGSETVIMILSLLMMTGALVRTGMVEIAGRAVLRHGRGSPQRMLLVVMVGAAGLSIFISNTAAAALFLPVVMGIAKKAQVSPARLLMPLAFASILTSSVTLISTSTNLVVSGLVVDMGLPRLRMFELAPVGIPIAIVGIAYMYFVGRRFTPDRISSAGLIDNFGVRSFLAELLVTPGSSLIGQKLGEAHLGRDLELALVRIVRAEEPRRYLVPHDWMRVREGDILLVEGERDAVLKVKERAGLELKPEVSLPEVLPPDEEAVLVEALVVPGSVLTGRSLRYLRFRERYGLQVLGLNRHGKNIVSKLSEIPLRAGDVLLLQGGKRRVATLHEDRVLSVLGAVDSPRGSSPRAWLTAGIFIGSLTLATTGVLSLGVAGFLGAFLIFATRCESPANVYRDVEWRVVILIACMLGVGEAMNSTGTALYFAQLLGGLSDHVSPIWMLGGFFILTVLLTQPMSNQAAAAVVVPLAVATAQHLQLDPRPFIVIVAVAASCSYLTPLEPACLIVYGPGRYRFIDFLRVGGPLTLLIFGVALALVPLFWPLR